MDDLIERLRTRPTGDPYLHMMVHEAADAIATLRAERDAARADAERLDWIESAIRQRGSVWFLPCGETLRFVQVRHTTQCENYPTVEGLRAAIDAAITATKETTK